MPLLTFRVNGHLQLSRNLRVFVSRLENMDEFYQEALDIVEFRENEIFQSQGQNVQKAEPWAPLAASTLKARERGWGYYKNPPSNPGTLRWTGQMQDTKVRTITPSSGRLAYPTEYAIYHQDGGGKLPRRVIIDIDNTSAADIVRALQAKINRDLSISGLQA